MRVYKIELDVNQCQYFLVEDKSLFRSELLKFDGTKMGAAWRPPAVYSYQPQLKACDFWSFQLLAAFATPPRVTKDLELFLSIAGELLPLPYKGEQFSVLNVTECVNCLDEQRSEWVYGKKTGKPIRIAKYAFHRDRMPESSIFKIPQTARADILCYEGLKDPVDEFKPTVEKRGLTGIKFRELWQSDA